MTQWAEASGEPGERLDPLDDQTVIIFLRQAGNGGDGGDAHARNADGHGTTMVGVVRFGQAVGRERPFAFGVPQSDQH